MISEAESDFDKMNRLNKPTIPSCGFCGTDPNELEDEVKHKTIRVVEFSNIVHYYCDLECLRDDLIEIKLGRTE